MVPEARLVAQDIQSRIHVDRRQVLVPVAVGALQPGEGRLLLPESERNLEKLHGPVPPQRNQSNLTSAAWDQVQ